MSLVSKIKEINNSIQKNATAMQNGKAPTETVDLSGMLATAGNIANSVATTIFNNAQEAMNVILYKMSKQDIRFLNCIDIVEDTKKRLNANANYNMSIDNMLFKIWEELH